MNKQTKRIIIAVLIIAAVAGGIYWYQNREPVQYQQGLYPVSPELAGKTIVLSDYIRYSGKDGKNALELLKAAVGDDKAELKDGFVVAIAGNKPADTHFWKLYVNAKPHADSPDKVETRKGDIMEWVVEKK